MSPASMPWKAGATVRTPRPTAPVELKVNLLSQCLAATLVDDIPVEII
ncbi:MAG: hypothetical protein ACI9DF_004584 [Verrucomicrobiales bacterium]